MELVERPRKPAPKVVLMAWAQQWAKEGVSVDWEKLLPPRGVHRSPSPLGGGAHIRLAVPQPSDEQGLRGACSTGEAIVYAAMTRLMVRRLTHAR